MKLAVSTPGTPSLGISEKLITCLPELSIQRGCKLLISFDDSWPTHINYPYFLVALFRMSSGFLTVFHTTVLDRSQPGSKGSLRGPDTALSRFIGIKLFEALAEVKERAKRIRGGS